MPWYDTFAHVYDLSTERIYTQVRQTVFEHIKKDSLAVLDLACGTGQNFPHLQNHFANDVQILGVDYSAGMLEKAKARVAKHGWTNVHLLQADARALDAETVNETLGRSAVDCVICTLGFSALPDWQQVFENTYELLNPGGQYLIIDVWAEQKVLQTYWVELIARADLKRKVWEPLKRSADDYTFQFLKGSVHIHGGCLFMATGFKPLA